MKKNSFIQFCLILFVLIAGVFLYVQKNDFRNPFESDFIIKSPYFCTTDSYGDSYFIDNSTMRIVKLNPENQVSLIINGGSSSASSFYNARALAVADDGSIYVNDAQLDEDGIYIQSERIIRYSSLGAFDKVVYEISYTGNESRPKLKPLLAGMNCIGNDLYFMKPDYKELSIMKLSPDTDAVSCIGRLALSNAAVSFLDTDLADDFSAVYCSTKTGEIVKYPLRQSNGLYQFESPVTLYKGHNRDENGNWSIPGEIALNSENTLYFTDTGTRQVLSLTEGSRPEVVMPGRYESNPELSLAAAPIFTRISIGSDDTVALTDTFYVTLLDKNNSVLLDSDLVTIQPLVRAYALLLWLLLIAVLAAVIYFVCLLTAHLLKRKMSVIEKLSILIVFVSFLIAAVVSNMLISKNIQDMNNEVSKNVQAMTNMASSLVNGDLFDDFNGLEDFENTSYLELKQNMDEIMDRCQQSGSGNYYIFYRTDGEQVYRVMDYTDTVGTVAPMDTAYKGSYYEEILTSGEAQFFDAFKDSTGIWTLAVAPIYNSAGDAVALIELGRNTIMLDLSQRTDIQNLIISILALVVVMVLIMNEGIHFIELFRTRKQYNRTDGIVPDMPVSVIRPLVFCLLISDYMQNGFEPIYVTQLYSPLFNLPQNIVISIALSAEVLSVSICSIIAGQLRKNLKIKSMLYIGALVAAFGFFLRGFAPSIPLFILGKVVTGMGMGFVFVALNTFIAERKDPDEVSHGFTGYFASSLAAINVGIVLGSSMAEKLNYKFVYYISAVIMVLCVAFISSLVKGNLESGIRIKKEEAKTSVFAFLSSRQIWGFFLFAFVPYLIVSYFLYYFYPLYANAAGVSDSKIGQTYLINGICVIYIGPFLAPLLLNKLGKRLSILFGCFLCVLGLLFFAWRPSVLSAILCILFMSVSDSFMFTCMTLHYNDIPAVSSYGFAPAAGIKSAMENLGMTLAPFVFSTMLLLGTSNGIISIAVCFGVSILCFLVLTANYHLQRKKS